MVTFQSLRNFMTLTRYVAKHRKIIKARRAAMQVGSTLSLANIELAKMGYHDSTYAQRVKEFNHAMILLTKAKCFTAQAMKTKSRVLWRKAFREFKRSQKFSQHLLNRLITRSVQPLSLEDIVLTSNGTEISFADDVPLVPEISPIVILQGSDYEMGYQYAQQLIQIFGPWILEQKAGQSLSDEEFMTLKKWEAEIGKYAPEILDLCQGWSAGATNTGVSMSYFDVLDLWAGHQPPAHDYFGGLPEIGPPLCSGVAAWRKATVDGRLITGSSGDHDCGYMVTVVAFPETGNNFIFTPFGATGDVPTAGPLFMFGHPGMNNKGVAYVHHGGGPMMIEPREYWGYGIRRAVSVLHILRFANSAREAQEMEMSYPIGDIGPGDHASVGGFYADSDYGYIIESRSKPLIIREAGLMGETDFLYANNSAIHPDVSLTEWMQRTKDDWLWDEHGGWYPKDFGAFSVFNLEDPFIMGMKWTYANSCQRNRFLFTQISKGIGQIDVPFMKALYRIAGTLPAGSWKEFVTAYNDGRWGDISTGNASNALVVVMKPASGNEGYYSLCTGPALRGLPPMSPRHCMPIYGETNAFWEIMLAANPAGVVADAKDRAENFIKLASTEFQKLDPSDAAHVPLKELSERAEKEFLQGEEYEGLAAKAPRSQALTNLAAATRAYTRAQVRALQVYQALVPSNKGGKINAV